MIGSPTVRYPQETNMSEQTGPEKVKEGKKEKKRAKRARKSDLDRKMDGLGWGLFFVWIGAVMLANLGAGAAMLGIGVITLGVQGARKIWGLKLESFWLVLGLVFTLAGLWSLMDTKLQVVPVLLIVAGLIILVSAFGGRRRKKERP